MTEKEWIGKKVKILLKNKYNYNGEVIEEDDTTITVIDKFNKRVEISKDMIAIVEAVDE